MTWVLVLVAVVALGGLLAWAAVRQRRHAGDSTMEQAKTRAHREGHGGEGGGIPL
jgi:uncharacterized membrane protein YjgN (DUF898 family)